MAVEVGPILSAVAQKLQLSVDNVPHQRWQFVSTFPAHFHDGSEQQVVESPLSPVPEVALRQFLTFVRNQLIILSQKQPE